MYIDCMYWTWSLFMKRQVITALTKNPSPTQVNIKRLVYVLFGVSVSNFYILSSILSPYNFEVTRNPLNLINHFRRLCSCSYISTALESQRSLNEMYCWDLCMLAADKEIELIRKLKLNNSLTNVCEMYSPFMNYVHIYVMLCFALLRLYHQS